MYLGERWDRLGTFREIFGFFILGGLIPALLPLLFCVLALSIFGEFSSPNASYQLLSAYFGNLFGVVLFTPLVVAVLKRSEDFWIKRWVSYLGYFLLILLAALLAYSWASQIEIVKQQREIAAYGERVSAQLKLRITAHQEVLASLRRLIELNPNLTYQNFNYFVKETLTDNPDIFALSFNTFVPSQKRDLYEHDMATRLSDPGFAIQERDPAKKLVRAREHDEYVPVSYIAPLEGNRAALGFNIKSEATRAAAIDFVLRTNLPATTSVLSLVQDQVKSPGILFIDPIHDVHGNNDKSGVNKHPIGFAVLVLKINQMIGGATGKALVDDLIFSISDGTPGANNQIVYPSDFSSESVDQRFVWHEPLTIFNRTWTVTAYPDAQWLGSKWLHFILWFGLGGGLFLCFLQAFLLLITGRAFTTQELVKDSTEKIQKDAAEVFQKETFLRMVINSISSLIFVKDENGRFVLGNTATAQLYQTTPEGLIGKTDLDFGIPAQEHLSGDREIGEIPEDAVIETVFEDRMNQSTNQILHYKSTRQRVEDASGRMLNLVISQDITDILNSNQRLIASEKRFQEVLVATREAIWDWHVLTGYVAHNQQWYEILGFQSSEVADTVEAFSQLIHPDDKPGVMASIESMLNGEVVDYESEHRMLGKNGIVWVNDRGSIVERDQDGNPIRVV